jgi:glycosyltransferase involved in cell wall biosynthesis
MNLLYLCDEYPPCENGGIGTVTQILAREMVIKGHQVWVCGFYPYYRKVSSYEEDQGVKVFRRFYGSRLLLQLSKHRYAGNIINIENGFNKYTKFLSELIKKNKIDLIEIPDFNEVFRYSGPRFIEFPDFGIPKVVKLHGTYSFVSQMADRKSINKRLYNKEKQHIHSATVVLAVSEFVKKVAIDIFHYSGKTHVINNGIFIIDSIKYNEDQNNKTVVFASKLSKQKGVLSLIVAWEKVIQEIPAAKLFLYGKVAKSTLESINKLITDKTRESIKLEGFINGTLLPEIYSIASCAIFPSYVESFGMAPMESMQIGCPTIYTKRASGEELITNGTDGILIDPDNIQEIADAIIFMLTDRTSAVLMGKNAALKVREKFDISIIADKHIEFYNTLLKQN